MQKFLIILCMSFITFCAYPQINDVVDIPKNEIVIKSKGEYSKIEYGHLFSTENWGHPSIPTVIKSYAVPIDAYDIHIDVSVNNKEEIEGKHLLYPIQPPKLSSTYSETDFVSPDSSIYNSLKQYPIVNAEIISDERVMGGRIVKVAYYPIVYIPIKQKLFIQQVSVSLSYESNNPCYFSYPNISENRKQIALSFIYNLVENPEVLVEQADKEKNILLSGESDLLLNKIVPDYVIITTNELKSAFQKLADWKTQKGVPTIIKTVEDIEQEYYGTDLINKIANYIEDIGKRWNHNALYILLGGDAELVPTRCVESVSSSCQELVATDADYVDNTAQYNAYHQTFRSRTIDRNAFLGRIPVKNIVQAEIFIERILKYEQANWNIDYSYLNNSLMMSAYMEPNNTDGYMAELDSFRTKNLPSYVNYWYLFDHFECKKNDHEKEVYDTRYGSELNTTNFLSILENGSPQGYPHFILHKDHSNTQVFGIAAENKGGLLESKDIFSLPELPYYNIIVSNSCEAANFASDCVAEDFLQKNTIAFFGNTDVGYRNEYPIFDTFLSSLYSKELKPIPQQFSAGYIHLQMLTNGVNTTFHRFHLLGDPEMPIWTDTPKTLYVSITPTQITTGKSDVTIQVHNLPKGEMALVCLTDLKDTYITKMISDTLAHVLHVTPTFSNRFAVTITAHNFRPFIKNISAVTDNDNLLSIAEISNWNGTVHSGQKKIYVLELKIEGFRRWKV